MADSMQNDAMERLKQMYSKAQPPNTGGHLKKHNEENLKKREDTFEKQPPVHMEKSENLLDFFMKDKEKSLILLLIVILMSEKADSSILLALMYLLM